MYSISRATLSPSANAAKRKQSHFIFSHKKYQISIVLIMLWFARIKGCLKILAGLNKKKKTNFSFNSESKQTNKIPRKVGYLMHSLAMTGNPFSKKNLQRPFLLLFNVIHLYSPCSVKISHRPSCSCN